MSQLFRVEQSERTSDDYLTPRWVFETMGIEFDLDVAAPPWDTHVPAKRKFTKADDGLSQPWEGRVWMNPPWSKPAPWVARFIKHSHGIAYLPTAKSQWFRDMWLQAQGVVASPDSQFDVDGVVKTTAFAAMLFAFGDDCVEAISRLGRVR